MTDYDTIISHKLVLAYLDLAPRFADLLQTLSTRTQTAPNAPAAPLMTRLVADLLAQTYRLTSREPFSNALPHLSLDAPPPTNAALLDILREAEPGARCLSSRPLRPRTGKMAGRRVEKPKRYPRRIAPCHTASVPATHAAPTKRRAGRRGEWGRPVPCVDA
ncbi:hypothetical protein PSQ19_08630 [Devosia algicola]|uniref:Uncharacterized protein n=1 Tax=Devosia algicola TaxID=3026418 RepID=A0ABY7YS89_9HYPH|nr:hypothetical protein [Devosia algicola]WDR04057.1 hypothetical protein PSQ19_08630 [Devosia algicola]